MSKKPAVNVIHAAVDMITVHEFNYDNPVVKVAAFALLSMLNIGQRFLLNTIQNTGRVPKMIVGDSLDFAVNVLTGLDLVEPQGSPGAYTVTPLGKVVLAASRVSAERHVVWYIEDRKDAD